MFHLCRSQVVGFTSKVFEKHQRKSDILSEDAGHRPASLLKMTFFHRCFSEAFLVTSLGCYATSAIY